MHDGVWIRWQPHFSNRGIAHCWRRAYRREFARAGGTIERIEMPTATHFHEIAGLYGNTVTMHELQEDLPVPIPIGRSYFKALSGMPVEQRRALIARVNGVAVGFAWLVDSGDAMIFSHCGLDHAKAVPSRASRIRGAGVCRQT